MKKRHCTWLYRLALGAGVIAPARVCLQTETRVLVLRVQDYANVPEAQWTLAQREADDVYADAGVRLVWVRGKPVPDNVASAARVNVVVVSRALAERHTGPNANALGVSDKPNATVYIYYSRIAETTAYGWLATGRLLGTIIGHEVGHLLLPDGHSKSGIMRQYLAASPFSGERFDDKQAETIRREIDSYRR